MKRDLLNESKELNEMIKELKNEYGVVELKMSTEDSGNSIEMIDFVNNRLINGVLPLNMKIGGPDAQNDIKEALRMGVSGIIAPMVETPFSIHKFVTALRSLAGEEFISHLFVSVNLESITAYRHIDEILKAPEIKDVDQIVIGVSDLSRSVDKQKDDPELVKMIRVMAQKSRNACKITRIGGIMSLSHTNPTVLRSLLEETKVDKLNTANVCFSVRKVPDLRSAYKKALNFEMKLNAYLLALYNEKTVPLKKRISSLKKSLEEIN